MSLRLCSDRRAATPPRPQSSTRSTKWNVYLNAILKMQRKILVLRVGGSVGRLVLIFEVLKELVERASLHVFKTSQ